MFAYGFPKTKPKLPLKGRRRVSPGLNLSTPFRGKTAKQIERLCHQPILEKVRYRLKQGDLTWEIDEYSGQNNGLVIAEVETDGSLGKLPPWVGPDISTDERYRNYSLVEHPFSTWNRKQPEPETEYFFRPSEKLPEAFRRILSEQIRRASNELGSGDEPTDDAVHEARKCVKRARSALRLIQPAITEQFHNANDRLRLVGRTLSSLRDAQALIETLGELEQEESNDDPASADLKGEFQTAFTRLSANKQGLIASPRTKTAVHSALRSLTQFADSISKLPLDEINFAAVVSSLEKTLKRGRKACSHAYSHSDAAHFHDFRKRVKDLRFQLAILSSLWPDVLSGYSDSAKDLEQYLGEDHNLAVLSDVLRKDHSHEDFSALSARIEKKQRRLRDRAKLAAGRLYSDSPKAWRARLNACWQAWQDKSK